VYLTNDRQIEKTKKRIFSRKKKNDKIFLVRIISYYESRRNFEIKKRKGKERKVFCFNRFLTNTGLPRVSCKRKKRLIIDDWRERIFF
jgi:hypothetical protein